MPYIDGRVVHDADAHIMETPDWLDEHVDRRSKAAVGALLARTFGGDRGAEIERCRELHGDADYRARTNDEIMVRKNHQATGAFLAADRPLALDALGVASQLVFPTTCNVLLEQLEAGDDVDLVYATAAASNRAQVAFCSVDPRLLPVANVPLADMQRAADSAAEALRLGARALLVPFHCPRDHATSHIGLDPVWAQAQEAGVPILFHVGAADFVLPKAHAENGLPREKDFHGGDENFRSVSYMAIPSGPMQALSLLILDGVLDRFPRLKVGVIELGAVWLPGYLRQLDAAHEAFARHERRLQKLELRPSDYVRRQVRVTPYPTEDVGWIIDNSDPAICMFSSDYPHVEGGRNPMKRFENTTVDIDSHTMERFYRLNFEDLMGAGMAGVPLPTAA